MRGKAKGSPKGVLTSVSLLRSLPKLPSAQGALTNMYISNQGVTRMRSFNYCLIAAVFALGLFSSLSANAASGSAGSKIRIVGTSPVVCHITYGTENVEFRPVDKTWTRTIPFKFLCNEKGSALSWRSRFGGLKLQPEAASVAADIQDMFRYTFTVQFDQANKKRERTCHSKALMQHSNTCSRIYFPHPTNISGTIVISGEASSPAPTNAHYDVINVRLDM